MRLRINTYEGELVNVPITGIRSANGIPNVHFATLEDAEAYATVAGELVGREVKVWPVRGEYYEAWFLGFRHDWSVHIL